jgi:hypothetical protein
MRYLPGTLVQRRDGYVFLKTHNGHMMAEHRWMATMHLGRPLKEGEVVIRRKPDRLNNKWENLVVVQHSLTKFQYLPTSRVIYVPNQTRPKGEKHAAERPAK